MDFFFNFAILRVNLAGPHYGNQSTHDAEVTSCQLLRFVYNLTDQSFYHPHLYQKCHVHCVFVTNHGGMGQVGGVVTNHGWGNRGWV